MTLRDEAVAWCRGRAWEARVPVLAYLAYVWFRHFGELEYVPLLGGLNLGIHELGHVVFRPFGEFLMVAGGTILQCLAPIVAAILFYRQQDDFFAVAFCLGWLGTNFFSCGTYAADARGQLNLVLVAPGAQAFGQDGFGDWTRMLERFDMLAWDSTISLAFRAAGSASMLLALALGGWLCWHMARSRKAG